MKREKSIGTIVFNNDKIRVKIQKKRRSRSATPVVFSARGQHCNGSYDSMETGPGRYVKRELI